MTKKLYSEAFRILVVETKKHKNQMIAKVRLYAKLDTLSHKQDQLEILSKISVKKQRKILENMKVGRKYWRFENSYCNHVVLTNYPIGRGYFSRADRNNVMLHVPINQMLMIRMLSR